MIILILALLTLISGFIVAKQLLQTNQWQKAVEKIMEEE